MAEATKLSTINIDGALFLSKRITTASHENCLVEEVEYYKKTKGGMSFNYLFVIFSRPCTPVIIHDKTRFFFRNAGWSIVYSIAVSVGLVNY